MSNPSDLEQTIIISAETKTTRIHKPNVILDKTQHKTPIGTAEELNIVLPTEQYEYLGLLGSGGMGHVLRVRDLKLNRSIAMKVLHSHHLQNPIERTRFLEEAQIEAQLQHPNIVSVHETGTLPSKHIYFTMREIRGISLKQQLDRRADPTEKRTMLLQNIQRVCETVGYAHNRGVVHCDIKPSNIMIGSYGEVWLVDWGIARLVHMNKVEEDPIYLISNEHSFSDDITGTPLYMSPEQANGKNEEIQPTSDVYALGVILYQILTGKYPYPRLPINELLDKVRYGNILPFPSYKNEHELPPGLVAICTKSLSFSTENRYQDGNEMAQELLSWLDGTQNKKRSIELITEGTTLEKESIELINNTEEYAEYIQEQLEQIPDHVPVEERYLLWSQEEAIKDKQLQSATKWRKAEQLLLSALNYSPDLKQTHLALANLYRRAHPRLEHKYEQSRLLEALEKHTLVLPFTHPKREELMEYIVGDGWITLHTTPSNATVVLEEYREKNRRLEPVPQYSLGETPLDNVSLPMGSYRLRIQKEGFEDVLYPVEITRNHNWNGIPPNATQILPIWLPPKGSLSTNERYIPAGHFQYGGDQTIDTKQKLTTLWLDGFIIAAHPFTNRQYIALLNQAHNEHIEDVDQIQPQSLIHGNQTAVCYGRDKDGHFFIQEDADGDLWELDWPVTCLAYDSICRAIEIYSKQTNKEYRLPSEEQWEKSARGVDGRLFPWGYFFQPTWTHCSTSKATVHQPARVYDHPLDISPYNVFGMAGNIREATQTDGESYTTRGGCWYSSGSYNRVNKRVGHKKNRLLGNLGFRIMRPIPKAP